MASAIPLSSGIVCTEEQYTRSLDSFAIYCLTRGQSIGLTVRPDTYPDEMKNSPLPDCRAVRLYFSFCSLFCFFYHNRESLALLRCSRDEWNGFSVIL